MSVPKTQKSIVLHAVGSPVVLEERPVPEPGEGQLLIKVTVAGCRFLLLHF
jgi:NADPH:quinone reductase-like Zn-dependent oxidoreductase